MPPKEQWILTFELAGHSSQPGPPIYLRVRKLLKSALRAYGLRCVHNVCKPIPPDPEHDATKHEPPF